MNYLQKIIPLEVKTFYAQSNSTGILVFELEVIGKLNSSFY